ncbi:MAG: hypothetical protein IJL74_02165 [Bacilli bacterium]|nr:hypothetical protein [Bacilli bacterium]
MCGNSNCEDLKDVFCTIVRLQKQGQCLDEGITSCDRPFLGTSNNSLYNTRPITLYTCPSNTLWTMPYTLNGTESTSTVFRVEAVEDCCATLRVLAPGDTEGTFVSTDSFFTINLNCVGAVRCLSDTYIACI